MRPDDMPRELYLRIVNGLLPGDMWFARWPTYKVQYGDRAAIELFNAVVDYETRSQAKYERYIEHSMKPIIKLDTTKALPDKDRYRMLLAVKPPPGMILKDDWS